MGSLRLDVEAWIEIRKALELVPENERNLDWQQAMDGVKELLQVIEKARRDMDDDRAMMMP